MTETQDRPEVDIVMPVFRAADLTKIAIWSCLGLTDWPFRLYVADDCSQDDATEKVFAAAAKDHVTVVRATRRRGFGDICNWAVNQHTRNPFICFLNSDTQAMPGWLTAMMRPMLEHPHIGIVGAKLLYPPTRGEHAYTIQHVGVARNAASEPYHVWRYEKFSYGPSMEDRFVNAVTGACMLVRRDCWKELRGFDRAYEFAQFEDVDFCWRARKAGWDVFLAANALLYHYEHGTGDGYVMQRHDKNRAVLLSRWAGSGSDEWLYGIGVRPCSQ